MQFKRPPTPPTQVRKGRPETDVLRVLYCAFTRRLIIKTWPIGVDFVAQSLADWIWRDRVPLEQFLGPIKI